MTRIALRGITKRFGQLVANDRITLTIASGTIHGLLGENGAGKTTLMNILSGRYLPDAGEIYLDDRPVHLTSPKQAIAAGIGMIHQHFMLVPTLTVTENIILGQPAWPLQRSQQAAQIAHLAQTYGLAVDPHARVADLPVGVQQRVEILKALYRGAQVLILDEPTAVLSPPEVAAFFPVLRELAAQGRTLILISHKLEEVMDLCHTITVLRQGAVVTTVPTRLATPAQLTAWMVGRSLELPQRSALPMQTVEAEGPPPLRVKDLVVRDDRHCVRVKGVSFDLRAGEILGIAGVDGNGQRELADAIAGLRQPSQGQIHLLGCDVTHGSPQQRRQLRRLAYIPEDRRTQGLVLDLSIPQNLILKTFRDPPLCQRGFLNRQRIQSQGKTAIVTYDIRGADGHSPVRYLSGGNQQKVVLARELAGNPPVIIALQPTRGLDVGATAFVQQQLLQARAQGAAILYISTELEEILVMSDRIAVLYNGEFAAILDTDRATREQIGWLMAGGHRGCSSSPPSPHL